MNLGGLFRYAFSETVYIKKNWKKYSVYKFYPKKCKIIISVMLRKCWTKNKHKTLTYENDLKRRGGGGLYIVNVHFNSFFFNTITVNIVTGLFTHGQFAHGFKVRYGFKVRLGFSIFFVHRRIVLSPLDI